MAWAGIVLDVSAKPELLDLGCGDARNAAHLAQQGAHVVGADVSRVALERAKQLHPEVELARLDEGEPLPFEDQRFDGVLCIHVLEHVADTQSFCSELRRVMKPGAALALTVPDSGWWRSLRRGPRAFEHGRDPLEPALRFYSKRSLRGLLEQFGFEQTKVKSWSGWLRASATRG